MIQKDILKQMPLQMKSKIIFFISVLFLTSCKIKNTEEIIIFMQNELKLHKEEMLKINDWINKQNYNKPAGARLQRVQRSKHKMN